MEIVFGIKNLRKARKLTRKELSLLSGVHPQTIVQLEKSERELYKAKLETLMKLSKALKCDIRALFPEGKIN